MSRNDNYLLVILSGDLNILLHNGVKISCMF